MSLSVDWFGVRFVAGARGARWPALAALRWFRFT